MDTSNLIERKNDLLRDLSNRLCEVGVLASVLSEIDGIPNAYLDDAAKEQITELVIARLRLLSQGWGDAFFEAQLALPEAEQEDGTVDDLPYDMNGIKDGKEVEYANIEDV